MMTNKFKVGDKVIPFRSFTGDDPGIIGNPGWIPSMQECIGKVITISRVSDWGYISKEGSWTWPEEVLTSTNHYKITF